MKASELLIVPRSNTRKYLTGPMNNLGMKHSVLHENDMSITKRCMGDGMTSILSVLPHDQPVVVVAAARFSFSFSHSVGVIGFYRIAKQSNNIH